MPTETQTPKSYAEFHRQLEGLLHIAPDSVTGDTSLSQLEKWDSLAILEFMIFADSEYKTQIDPDEIAQCKTVDELAHATLNHASRPV